ncbi:MAG: glycosyltransferase [Candidatus Bathyarchaeota archaeon]|nr:glycosyltransferase [Candidatus Bathyarchaeota archaeon]
MSSKHNTSPFVSIVICTYNRKRLLKKCLDSLFALKYPKTCYEIVIVDGGSTDGTHRLLQQFPEIRLIVEKRFGLAYARNKGAELSKGSIVAYTDDDCVVDQYWLNCLLSGFQYSSSIVGVGGPVLPVNSNLIPNKIFVKPALGLFDEGKEPKLVRGIITSNAAFKREIFNATRFDEALGTTRRGKLILCGEDVDFCETLIKSNYKLLYVPDAKVYHQLSKNRLRVAYIVKHAIHNGISVAKFFKKANSSRVWMIRLAVGRLFQSILSLFSDRSFTTCYSILASLSALFVCVTGLDKVLL